MCRNIRPLFNFDPPASHEEIQDASLQFVRKISGFNKPSKTNEQIFTKAVDDISNVCGKLLSQLQTDAPMRNREMEKAKARMLAIKRYSKVKM